MSHLTPCYCQKYYKPRQNLSFPYKNTCIPCEKKNNPAIMILSMWTVRAQVRWEVEQVREAVWPRRMSWTAANCENELTVWAGGPRLAVDGWVRVAAWVDKPGGWPVSLDWVVDLPHWAREATLSWLEGEEGQSSKPKNMVLYNIWTRWKSCTTAPN